MNEPSKQNSNTSEGEHREEVYTIPIEASCSAEFPEGCILSE